MNTSAHLLRRPTMAAALFLVGTTLLTACGSSPDSSSTESGDSCVDEAQAAFDAIPLVDPADNPKIPTTPVDAAAAAGKRVAILSGNNAVPPVKENSEEVERILELVGLEATVFDTKSQTSLNNQLMAQAIAQGYDAIYTFGMDITSVQAQLEKAKEAGIPVIESGGYPNDPGVIPPFTDGYAGILEDGFTSAKAKVSYALATTGCSGSYAIMTVDYPTFKPSLRAAEEEFAKLCPECDVQVYLIDFTKDIVGSSRDNAVAALTKQPNLKAILTSDVWSPYQVPAVEQAGKDVKFFTEFAASVVIPDIKNGKVSADVDGYQASPYQAWLSADLVLRALTGLDASTGIQILPVSLLTPENIDTYRSYPEASKELEAAFKPLWGLS